MSHADQCPSTMNEGPKQRPAKAVLAANGRAINRTVNGSRAWRSAEEFEDTAEFREFVEREFPAGASELLASSRRGFLQVMGASLALAGLATVPGCRRPDHKIVSFSQDAAGDIVVGKPLYFATSMPIPGGGAEGLLAETHEGRPTKLEGNPLHPINQGKSGVMSQALVLGLYDPDRLKYPFYKPAGKEASWDDFASWAGEHFEPYGKNRGKGLALVVDKKTCPTRDAWLKKFQDRYREAKVVHWSAVDARGQAEATASSFGGPMREVLDLAKARVILTLDADPLRDDPGALVNARGLSAGRAPRVVKEKGEHGHPEYEMSRVYAVESGWTLVGGQADHRLALPPSRVALFAVELARFILPKMGVAGAEPLIAALDAAAGSAGQGGGIDRAFLEEAAKDLMSGENRGKAVVLAGRHMPAAVHAACHAINQALGSLGTVVKYHPMTASQAYDSEAGLRELAGLMKDGAISTLVCLEANPCYDAPGDLDFAGLYAKVPATVCLSVAATETAAASTWSLNGCHVLESWGDAEANDGTISPIMPMIAPLFGHVADVAERQLPEEDRPRQPMSDLEFIAFLAGERRPDGYRLVRDAWRDMLKNRHRGHTDEQFESVWRRSLQDGVHTDQPTVAFVSKGVDFAAAATLVRGLTIPPAPGGSDLEIVFTTGHLHDGRFANVGWLQELPDLGTMVCWDNPAVMSPATAVRLGFWGPKENRYTKDKYPRAVLGMFAINGRRITLPVWILPGMADDTVQVKLGYGREVCGLVGDGVGFNAYALRSAGVALWASRCAAEKTDGEYWIASTQNHWSMESRTSIVRAIDLPAYAKYAHEPLTWKDPTYGTETTLNLAERLGELSHTPPNVSIYKNPYAQSPTEPAAGSPFAKGPQWGMTIDLSKCTGCSACTVACQSENNIPVVGKKETAKGREMTWIRVDRYFASMDYGEYGSLKKRGGGTGEGDVVAALNRPEEMLHQPVACVHCENAPCETVCPVNATVHTKDGMNAMAYNRCIGTRYCANNCPHKVRRFNFFDYGVTKFNGGYYGKKAVEGVAGVIPLGDKTGATGSTVHNLINPNLVPPRLREKLDQITRMSKNPDVTVRSRGVMEKCSYCVQRINTARIEITVSDVFKDAKDRGRIPDGFFQVACQQACPSDAITFGDILDDATEYASADGTKRRGSKVHAARNDPRSYALLGYLITRPRTSHMIKVRNPNPNLVPAERKASWDHPFHGAPHDAPGGGHEGHGHASADDTNTRPTTGAGPAAVFEPVKRSEDAGYALSLRVLGVGAHA